MRNLKLEWLRMKKVNFDSFGNINYTYKDGNGLEIYVRRWGGNKFYVVCELDGERFYNDERFDDIEDAQKEAFRVYCRDQIRKIILMEREKGSNLVSKEEKFWNNINWERSKSGNIRKLIDGRYYTIRESKNYFESLFSGTPMDKFPTLEDAKESCFLDFLKRYVGGNVKIETLVLEKKKTGDLWESVDWRENYNGNIVKYFKGIGTGITIFKRNDYYNFVNGGVFGDKKYKTLEEAKNAAKEEFLKTK